MWNLRDIYSIAVMLGNQVGAILEDGHHAQPEQIYLYETHVADIFLVPLDDVATWHTRPFDWNDRGELALRDNHAT